MSFTSNMVINETAIHKYHGNELSFTFTSVSAATNCHPQITWQQTVIHVCVCVCVCVCVVLCVCAFVCVRAASGCANNVVLLVCVEDGVQYKYA